VSNDPNQCPDGPLTGEAAFHVITIAMARAESGVDSRRLVADARRAQGGNRDALIRLRVGSGWRPSGRGLHRSVGARIGLARRGLPQRSAAPAGRRRRPPQRSRSPDRPARRPEWAICPARTVPNGIGEPCGLTLDPFSCSGMRSNTAERPSRCSSAFELAWACGDVICCAGGVGRDG
jgi:hypothetical protein